MNWDTFGIFFPHANSTKLGKKNQNSFISKNYKKKPCIGLRNILYIKATMVSVCVGSAWKILPVTARSLWSWRQTGQGRGRAGQPRQPLRGATRGAISIKEILGENRGTCI